MTSLKRIFKIGFITIYTLVLLIVVIGFSGYLYFQGTLWKDETLNYARSAGRLEAMGLFRKGYLWKYVIDGKRDDVVKLNRKEGPFELWAVFYEPAAGPAHKAATQAYVSAFNSQMDAMIRKPERFLQEVINPLNNEDEKISE